MVWDLNLSTARTIDVDMSNGTVVGVLPGGTPLDVTGAFNKGAEMDSLDNCVLFDVQVVHVQGTTVSQLHTSTSALQTSVSVCGTAVGI